MNTDTHSARAYEELANISLSLIPDDFDADMLAVARAYIDVRSHVRVGRIVLVDVCRRTSAEDDATFADGSSADASATVECTTYWLVNEARLALTCKAYYSYSIHGHSGGVAEVDGEPEDVVANSADVLCTRDEWRAMHTLARLSALSCHRSVVGFVENEDFDLMRTHAEMVAEVCRQCELTRDLPPFESEADPVMSFQQWTSGDTVMSFVAEYPSAMSPQRPQRMTRPQRVTRPQPQRPVATLRLVLPTFN